MLWLYVRHRYRHLRDFVVVQTLLPTHHLWNSNRNDELHMGRGGHRDNNARVAVWRGGFEFDSNLTLITVDTLTDAWVDASRLGFYLIMFGPDYLE